jgi:hypothetical protein
MPCNSARLDSKRAQRPRRYLYFIQDKKVTLTMEDLSAAIAEHGVTVKKPEFYV